MELLPGRGLRPGISRRERAPAHAQTHCPVQPLRLPLFALIAMYYSSAIFARPMLASSLFSALLLLYHILSALTSRMGFGLRTAWDPQHKGRSHRQSVSQNPPEGTVFPSGFHPLPFHGAGKIQPFSSRFSGSVFPLPFFQNPGTSRNTYDPIFPPGRNK